MSDTSLTVVVEDFAPKDLKDIPERHCDRPLLLYCAARLWAVSGFIQTPENAIADRLSLFLSKSQDLNTKRPLRALRNYGW